MNKLLSIIVAVGMVAVSTSCCNQKCETPVADNDQAVANQKIRLNVFATVEDSTLRANFVEIAKKLVEASRNDAGCISYDFLESATVPGEYMIVETWENDSLLEVHSEASHFKEYVPQLNSLGTMRTDKFIIE